MNKPTGHPAIEVNEVEKSFKDVHAVRGISFSIQPGEFVALLGPNGAGKTTVVEMIEGIQKPDKGEIKINGLHWNAGNHTKLNQLLGISLQETWFIEKLTVKETLVLFASFYKLDKSRVEEILVLVDLTEKHKAFVKNLSGGQRQRLALGISLINYPEILLLDEPTTGLDPNARRDIWHIMQNLKKGKKTSLILTTHYMEEAEQLCDRIIIIDQGKILARGSLDELLKSCGAKEIIEFSLTNELDEFVPENINGILRSKKNGETFVLEVEQIIKTLPALLQYCEKKGYTINSLECRKVTLDDLFISMTGRHLID